MYEATYGNDAGLSSQSRSSRNGMYMYGQIDAIKGASYFPLVPSIRLARAYFYIVYSVYVVADPA